RANPSDREASRDQARAALRRGRSARGARRAARGRLSQARRRARARVSRAHPRRRELARAAREIQDAERLRDLDVPRARSRARRTLLRASVQLTLLAPFARVASALPNADARFVIVILRGALDGLAAVAPYGEPQYRSLRGALALDSPGSTGGALKLDGLFALHPSLTNLHAMYAAKELAVLHAVATPYRERSHFDAQ